jgi:hypothetical protein
VYAHALRLPPPFGQLAWKATTAFAAAPPSSLAPPPVDLSPYKESRTGEKRPTGENVNSVMKQVASMVKVLNHAGETEFGSVAKHVQQYGERI